jgi:ribosome-associated protein
MEAEFVSKTKRKRQVEELQQLGAALVELAPQQLEAIAMPPELLAAVLDAQRISRHEAKRRQLQYIGKLMRKADPEPIREALAQLTGKSVAARVQQKRLEQWRERLIADDEALTAFAADHPGADIQALRTLIRNARKEIAETKPPRAQRALFRMVRELTEGPQE